ncbi:cytochrome P450, partial [Phlebopus sp. FC_14]
MMLYPQVQKCAQKDIEAVVGCDRLSEFGDWPHLSYIDAMLCKTLRWHPVNPLSLPWSNINDDTYGGYVIPKDTPVSIYFLEVMAMAHDETKYLDPFSFSLDRFLDDDGKLNNDDISYVFGFGRRICIGINLTDRSVWSAMANLLAAFEFQRS